MSEPLSRRLEALDAILSGSRTPLVGAAPGEIESVDLCLRTAPLDRIRQLTAMLADGRAGGVDDADRLAAHLLLTDYRHALANLRMATQVVAARLTTTSTSLKPAKAFVRRQEQVEEKRRQKRS